MSILIFDSGIGGLTVLREARALMPDRHFIYVADDAAFPYGNWKEAQLLERMIGLFGRIIERFSPQMIVIACNTATTLAIDKLRQTYPDQVFVGTVPAIKPAAERTRSGLVSVLSTYGTAKRQYTQDLIDQWAGKCEVNLVGSRGLAGLAEKYMRGQMVDEAEVEAEIGPCFVQKDERKTDIVVLACTHFPFLVNRMRKMAPWPVDWIDTGEAIARRAQSLVGTEGFVEAEGGEDIACFTAGVPDVATARLVSGFGLKATEL